MYSESVTHQAAKSGIGNPNNVGVKTIAVGVSEPFRTKHGESLSTAREGRDSERVTYILYPEKKVLAEQDSEHQHAISEVSTIHNLHSLTHPPFGREFSTLHVNSEKEGEIWAIA
jgi:hypothetical protein